MSFVQPTGFSGVLLSSKPEELCSKIDAFGNVVEDLVSEKSVEAIDECTAAIENFSFPGDFVQYVINGIHELTGFNWWMLIVLTAFLVSVLMSPVSMRVQKQALELQIVKLRSIILVARYSRKNGLGAAKNHGEIDKSDERIY
ncbi:hypothetical protein ARALYDRAFT_893288 [Arabidopsis lyrata subsp. lyrata]|uniref:Uncharacterized protein n=1 Tax=Arabidopsis lyrata subsp. lyrata TaxID=81972 RepID=D7KUV3_ARALL|nr:hypothetical protein ARALYDRAFT_893288 [Arabidopsis lyrata subsp. lyrata]